MNKKDFFQELSILVLHYKTDGSKLEAAKVADALAFCEYHSDDNNVDTDEPAPTDHRELMEILLCNAGQNERYTHKRWESYVRGCAPLVLTPNADAIIDHYLTAEQVKKHEFCWDKCPKNYDDWQQFEACRLHVAAEMLCNIAFAMGLLAANR